MKQTNPQHDFTHDPTHEESLAPLDAFEQRWVDQLAQREPELKQTEDEFVQRVMQAEAASAAGSFRGAPAVLARIGEFALPYAVAAALLLAAFVGYRVLTSDTDGTPDEQPLANQTDKSTQPDDPPAVATNSRPKVELGKLIAKVKTTATAPANGLTANLREVPDTLNIDRVFELLGNGVPDLKEILTPLEPKSDPNNKQSRA